ncbi:MAG: hypothetical protein NZ988_03005 [Thaumarchaeota archaeon]|nr:hypothetical protein [Candidatus Calditenuaceae archaeon]MDW8187000.1 hypothetical protein [Nitrososphaerota archaeon]
MADEVWTSDASVSKAEVIAGLTREACVRELKVEKLSSLQLPKSTHVGGVRVGLRDMRVLYTGPSHVVNHLVFGWVRTWQFLGR